MSATYTWILFFVQILSSCVTTNSLSDLPAMGPERCQYLVQQIQWNKPIHTLNRISYLFHSGCYEDTITIGTKARDRYRHKTYSFSKESLELFIPEGTITEYVLESYERGYLTFLITLAYAKVGRLDAIVPELNRLYNEEIASIYNHGQDPVNALLQAVLWDNFPREGFSSRPFWLWLSQASEASAELRTFAIAQVTAIDKKTPRPTWNITEISQFPQLDWSIRFENSSSGYFSIETKDKFLPPCQTENEILIPTESWFRKIAMRHSHSYHPLVNVKSWIRLPIGIAYGISTATAGAAIMVSGCVAGQAIEKNGSVLCNLSISGGIALIEQSDDVVENSLKPDLRHWEKVPSAIHVSAANSPRKTQCSKTFDDLETKRIL